MKEYVSTRVGLERVCLLVHTKRGMKPLDYELVDLMERCAFHVHFSFNQFILLHGLDASTS